MVRDTTRGIHTGKETGAVGGAAAVVKVLLQRGEDTPTPRLGLDLVREIEIEIGGKKEQTPSLVYHLQTLSAGSEERKRKRRRSANERRRSVRKRKRKLVHNLVNGENTVSSPRSTSSQRPLSSRRGWLKNAKSIRKQSRKIKIRKSLPDSLRTIIQVRALL
ncbi:hypothetical protein BT96DRAFT_22867 [Gymnopus androsaceus JB14]|uniref:Uncharacterized protein n=1 Tax=Gymnopus androsaceus JB14 TaxID=1447944 RepID=A0A6A4I7W9_9AGAR|nr:hypothetical protein BT96DRAFT_22867 [Gymnopus androsaceus JB14]